GQDRQALARGANARPTRMGNIAERPGDARVGGHRRRTGKSVDPNRLAAEQPAAAERPRQPAAPAPAPDAPAVAAAPDSAAEGAPKPNGAPAERRAEGRPEMIN